MPLWLAAGLWGLLAGSALLVGAAIGYFARVPTRLIAAIMAFGSGVLISALSFDLMDEAYKRGGFRFHRRDVLQDFTLCCKVTMHSMRSGARGVNGGLVTAERAGGRVRRPAR